MTESTSRKVGRLASKALRDPSKITHEDIRKLAASALTQVEAEKAAARYPPAADSPPKPAPSTPDQHESVKAVKGQEPRA